MASGVAAKRSDSAEVDYIYYIVLHGHSDGSKAKQINIDRRVKCSIMRVEVETHALIKVR